jgi:hypothetical protein
MDLYLGLPLCSTGLHICFCATTMLFFIAIALHYCLKLGIVIPPALLFLVSIVEGELLESP